MRRALFSSQRAALALLVALGFASSVRAAFNEQAFDTTDNSALKVSASTPLLQQPDTGFFPLHLRVENRGGGEQTLGVHVSSNGNSFGFVWKSSVSVGANQVREFDLLVPLAGLPSSESRYQNLVCTIIHPDVRGQASLERSSGSLGAFTIIAEPLGSAAWSKLEAELNPSSSSGRTSPAHTAPFTDLVNSRLGSGRTSRNLAGSILHHFEEMPADARAFSGVGGLWLRDVDWAGLAGARRSALRQWVVEGGHLFIALPAADATPAPAPVHLTGLPEKLQKDPTPLGLGDVRTTTLTGQELAIPETADQVLNLDDSPLPPWSQDFAGAWRLPELVGQPKLNVPLIIAFVCVFGILIGPVNFFWLAPATRRHRLFFTVPLLSLGASLVLLGAIALGDGIGAVGFRQALLFVPAGENRLTLLQEQVVRTRLLLGRSFQLPETVAASFLPLADSGNYRGGGARASLQREGTTMSGDWFRTRSLQGLFLRESIPSRGEVILRPSAAGAPPELLSTLPARLRQVRYVDAAGQYWQTDELTTGRPAKLEPATADTYATEMLERGKLLSAGLRQQFERTLRRPGYFYAEADPTPETTIATLPSISWQQQRVLCFGPTAPLTPAP